jgi:putative ABC transport system ATP-binding protein
MIEAINIHKYYGNQHVLKGIYLQIKSGQFIAIMGRSGSGKTTLLNILSGLDYPDEGNIKINGNKFNFTNDAKMTEYRQKKVGFIFQQFNLLDNLTLFDNVAIPLYLNKNYNKKNILEMLDRVGLVNHKNKLPAQLSGGEKQRGAIARALIHSPEIIFADEPTGSLDSETGESILKLLKNLHSESKATIVLVTHDNVVAKWADKIIHIRDGVIE